MQNLPLGIFSFDGALPRAGVAIGEEVLDLRALSDAALLPGYLARALAGNALNDFLALGASARTELRGVLSDLLREGARDRDRVEPCLRRAASCAMHLPAVIGDYTDFYVGIHHATNVGRLFRPDDPLMPNYKWVPIGYHGRASSIRPSGSPVRRPNGQTKQPDAAKPSFGPSGRLDYELGIWVGMGNDLGRPIPISRAAEHIGEYCLLNDWSARDVQAWEYQPLGPFLAKNFATTISPWIVTPEALAPFRAPQPARPAGDPQPLDYLTDEDDLSTGALAIRLEVHLSTRDMRARGLQPQEIAVSDARHMYWSPAQIVTHHTSGGCNLRPGDLIGTGTISAPGQGGCGALIETTKGGRELLALHSGEERRFLEDDDEVIFKARCVREGLLPSASVTVARSSDPRTS